MMRNLFLAVAAALFIAAIAFTYMDRPYITHGGMIISNSVQASLVFGLAIAGGLALVAAALDRTAGGRPVDDRSADKWPDERTRPASRE